MANMTTMLPRRTPRIVIWASEMDRKVAASRTNVLFYDKELFSYVIESFFITS